MSTGFRQTNLSDPEGIEEISREIDEAIAMLDADLGTCHHGKFSTSPLRPGAKFRELSPEEEKEWGEISRLVDSLCVCV